jgi:hypothetical protein
MRALELLTKKPLFALWWSMFWRFYLYISIADFLLGFVGGFVGQDMLKTFAETHIVVMTAIKGGVLGYASMIALKQSLKKHFPKFS